MRLSFKRKGQIIKKWCSKTPGILLAIPGGMVVSDSLNCWRFGYFCEHTRFSPTFSDRHYVLAVSTPFSSMKKDLRRNYCSQLIKWEDSLVGIVGEDWRIFYFTSNRWVSVPIQIDHASLTTPTYTKPVHS